MFNITNLDIVIGNIEIVSEVTVGDLLAMLKKKKDKARRALRKRIAKRPVMANYCSANEVGKEKKLSENLPGNYFEQSCHFAKSYSIF